MEVTLLGTDDINFTYDFNKTVYHQAAYTLSEENTQLLVKYEFEAITWSILGKHEICDYIWTYI